MEEAAVLILLTEQSQQSPLFIGLRLSAGRPSQVYHLIFTSNVNVLIFTSEVKIWDITLNLSWELGTVPVSTVNIINVSASEIRDKVGFLVFYWEKTTKIMAVGVLL